VRFFYDTEFNERGRAHPLELISIAMVAEDGRRFYACNAGFDASRATRFARTRVLALLPPRTDACWMQPGQIARELRAFVGAGPPELWSDFAAYDHVVLAQLFGTMDEWPPAWPKFTCDIQQWRLALGNPPLPEIEGLPDWVGEQIGLRSLPDAMRQAHVAIADALLTWGRWLLLEELHRKFRG